MARGNRSTGRGRFKNRREKGSSNVSSVDRALWGSDSWGEYAPPAWRVDKKGKPEEGYAGFVRVQCAPKASPAAEPRKRGAVAWILAMIGAIVGGDRK